MEKQSTSKFLRSVIAVVALFMLAVSGFLLTSCKHVHSEPNNFGACTDCVPSSIGISLALKCPPSSIPASMNLPLPSRSRF